MTDKNVKVIFDTNVWISFLVGRRLAKIKWHISDGSITIYLVTGDKDLLAHNPFKTAQILTPNELRNNFKNKSSR